MRVVCGDEQRGRSQSGSLARLFLSVICLLGLAVVWQAETGTVFSQEGDSSEERAALEVPHCTISLIDRVTLAADRAGVLGQVPFEEGDEVPAGTLVAQLINNEAAARLQLATLAAQSEIAILVAEKTRDVAEAELQQAQFLNQRQPVYTEFEMRRLKLTLDQTVLEREKAVHEQHLKRVEQEVAQAQLAQHDVKSTFAGTVVRVFKQQGEAVQQGEPLLEIASNKRLRIEGYVPVLEVHQLRVGDEVRVELDDNSFEIPPLTGKLRFIDLTVQSVTQEVRVWAEVDNSEQILKPGQLATMRVYSRTQSTGTE